MSSTELASLVERYKRELPTATQFQRAELESQIWALASPEARRSGNNAKRKFLHSLLGGAQPDYDLRYTLLHAGALAEPFWHRMEHDNMSLWTAIGLWRQAKKIAVASKMPLADAIKTLLSDFDLRPVTHLPSGKVTRRRPGTRLPSRKEAMLGKKKIAKDDRSAWTKLREILAAMAAEKLEGADSIIAEKLYRDFERDLRVLFDTYQSKVNRLRATEKESEATANEVPRFQVMRACRSLGIDPPKPGKPVDLAMANRNKKRLAREYHPDSHGGSETTRASYEAVMEAYALVEQYNEQIEASLNSAAV